MNKEPYSSLYKILGFYPDNIHLYEQAFLHKSSSVESGDGRWLNNERLEFLGDAVLDAVVADIVYKHFQNKREGFLTNTRSKIVQRETMNVLLSNWDSTRWSCTPPNLVPTTTTCMEMPLKH